MNKLQLKYHRGTDRIVSLSGQRRDLVKKLVSQQNASDNLPDKIQQDTGALVAHAHSVANITNVEKVCVAGQILAGQRGAVQAER